MGLFPFVVAYPYIRALLPTLCHAFVDGMPFALVRLGAFKEHAFLKLGFHQKGERYTE
jgi:hypothetical protein